MNTRSRCWGEAVIGGALRTIAYVGYASPDGAQPSQNNTQCFRVVSHEALDILEQKRPRPLGVNGLDDAKNYLSPTSAVLQTLSDTRHRKWLTRQTCDVHVMV